MSEKEVKNVLYFHGGEEITERDSQHINEKAFDDLGGFPTVLIFPWTGWFTKPLRYKYRGTMENYFNDLGAKEIQWMEVEDGPDQHREKIEAANLIYLPGGGVEILVERIKKRNITPKLKDFRGVIMGNSAGSLALCKRYVVIKEQGGRPATKLEPGLGLVNFAVSVHYKSSKGVYYSGDSLEEELQSLSEKVDIKIYAIPERCALLYKEGKIEPIGEICMFEEGKKRMIRADH